MSLPSSLSPALVKGDLMSASRSRALDDVLLVSQSVAFLSRPLRSLTHVLEQTQGIFYRSIVLLVIFFAMFDMYISGE